MSKARNVVTDQRTRVVVRNLHPVLDDHTIDAWARCLLAEIKARRKFEAPQ